MAPGLGLFVLFALGPALATAALSLTDISGVPNIPFHFIGLSNYVEYFTSGASRDNVQAVERTLIFCLVVTVVQNAIALGLAVLLNRRLRGRTAFRTIIFIPVILGVTVIGLIWSLILDPADGPVAAILMHFGKSSALLGDNFLAFPLVIAIQIWSALGYSLVIFLAGLQTIPAELHEAARVDGANAWQTFRHATFPMLAPSVTINSLLAIIGSLQAYQIVYVLTHGNYNTSVLSYQVYQLGFNAGTYGASLRQGYASALSMVQFGLIAVVALAALVYLRRREVQL
jgi:raffinose/stachyose/melibiose transport system permease protein